MGREVRDDIGGQVTGYGGLESVNKVQKEHAALEVKVILINLNGCRNDLQGISNNEGGS